MQVLRALLGCLGATLAFGTPSALALGIQGTGIVAVEGATFTGQLGTISELGPLACPAPSSYSATVTWSDNTTTAGTVGAPTRALLDCTYPVTVGHRFAEEGTEPVSVTVSRPGDQEATETSSAAVADAPLATSAATALAAQAGTPLQATVARFTDADPNASADGYRATIAWGDGTTTSEPAIAADPAGGFTVSARHTYAAAGSFATAVTIYDDGGSTAQATGVATVTSPPAAAAPPASSPSPAPAPAPPPTDAAATPSRPPTVGVSAPRLAGHDSLALRLTCPAGAAAARCRGVARVIAVPASAHNAPLARGTALGSALFLLRAGESQSLSIPVSRRLRPLLRHAHSARLAGLAIAFGASGHNAAATGPAAAIGTASLR